VVFSIPLFLFVRQTRSFKKIGQANVVKAGFKQCIMTFKKFAQYKTAFLFLLSYWFYIDGVDTIIRMAVDYGMALGFHENSLIAALLLVQFIGFPAALVFGHIGKKIGAKKGILIALAIYITITFGSYYLQHLWQFYLLAISIALVQGGVQALSRSYYISLIPVQQAGEFLGFYNMFGKFAVFLGPALMGTVAVLTGNPRYSVFAVTFLLVIGAGMLCFVKPDQKLLSRNI